MGLIYRRNRHLPRHHFVEALERRTLLSTLTVTGTSGDDNIVLDISGSNYLVTVNGVTQSFALAPITDISISELGGNDTCELRVIQDPATVTGGDGNDTLYLASMANPNLDQIPNAVSFVGGNDNDFVVLRDSANTFGDSYNCLASTFTRNFFGGLAYSTVEKLQLDGATGANTIFVTSTAAGCTYDLYAGNGTDTLDVGGGNIQANIAVGSTVNLHGDAGTDTIVLSDTADTSNDYQYLIESNSALKQSPGGASTVSGTINYDTHEALTFNGGSNRQFIRCDTTASGVTTTITCNGGNDEVWLGWNGGNLGDIQGNVTVNGGAGSSDRVVAWDDLQSHDNAYTVTGTVLKRAGGPDINWMTNVESLSLQAAQGSNTLNIMDMPAGKPIDVNTNGGNDTVNLGSGPSASFSGILSAVSVTGGGGTDSVHIDDTRNSSSSTYAITTSTVTISSQSGFGGLTYSDIDALDFTIASGSTTNVNSTSSATPITIGGGFGSHTVNVGAGDLSNIQGAVTFNAGSGSDQAILSDHSTTTGASFTVTATSITRSGFAGFAYNSAVDNLTLNGSNNCNIDSTGTGVTTTLNVPSAGLYVGHSDGSAVNVDGPLIMSGNVLILYVASVTKNGSAAPISFDYGIGSQGSALIEDSGNPLPATWSMNGAATSYVNSSGASVSISFSVSNPRGYMFLTDNCGDGHDTFNVNSTIAGLFQFRLIPNNGNDQVLFAPTTNDLSNCQGGVAVSTLSPVAVTLCDSANTGSFAYSSSSDGVERPGFAGVGWYLGESLPPPQTLSLQCSAGNNTITVDGNLSTTGGLLTINGNSGNDTVIRRAGMYPVLFDGGAGADSLVVDDGGGTGNDTWTVAATSVSKSDGYFGTSCSAVESIALNTSTGANVVNITSTQAGTPISISTGQGNDTVNVGAGDLNSIFAPVTVDGGAGTDSLTIDDHSNAGQHAYVSTATTFSRDGVTLVNYSNMEHMSWVGAGGAGAPVSGNTVTVNGTASGCPVSIDPGPNATVHINDASATGPVSVVGAGGMQSIDVNSDNTGTATLDLPASVDLASLTIGSGGLVRLTAGGNKLLYTGTLTMSAGGTLDLNDNDMIVDYTSASQLAAIQTLINAARHGGAWDLAGITSSSAKDAIPKNTTLGAIESSSFKSVYGAAAPFDGHSIDNTAVLVKYTYYGDADFNGKVDGADYARIDATFNLERTQGNIGGWFNGDCDGNGKVDGADYALIDAAFNSQGAPLRPASLSLRPRTTTSTSTLH